jgi:hypothetical protein
VRTEEEIRTRLAALEGVNIPGWAAGLKEGLEWVLLNHRGEQQTKPADDNHALHPEDTK